ncbi:hypothetical protein L6452_20333 [Arctium lappa]|uniref:Uncharacterized protein n=1 Tax=Arctium lappa TaxID=4217 RepID=A0ACB9BAM4_ARCLA|nr:hypothetical protein L6452_20333 [Arctium lappa]
MQPAMWTIRTDFEDFDLHFVCDWDLEWLGNKEQLVEDQKLGEDDPLEVEVDACYSGDESDIEGERKKNIRKLRK